MQTYKDKRIKKLSHKNIYIYTKSAGCLVVASRELSLLGMIVNALR